MDNIQKIFESQKELNEKLVPGLSKELETPEGRLKWIMNYHRAMEQESAELLDSVDWKWWKHSNKKIDYQNLKVEIADILFFTVSIAIAAGFNHKDIVDTYFKKLKLNHERADNGYKTGEYQKVDLDGNEDNRSI
tara:strand:+ start:3489 stop:3893 length:405 start_codon:yes stop_codon:yes gene_type:complete